MRLTFPIEYKQYESKLVRDTDLQRVFQWATVRLITGHDVRLASMGDVDLTPCRVMLKQLAQDFVYTGDMIAYKGHSITTSGPRGGRETILLQAEQYPDRLSLTPWLTPLPQLVHENNGPSVLDLLLESES